MIKVKDDSIILNKAVQAMRKAIKKIIYERKKNGTPLIIWQDGKVVKIPMSRIGKI